jgi:hypothetical protein
MTDLTLETRDQADTTEHIGPALLTPAISEDYWSYRVQLSERQAVIGFPKFYTTGIGFAAEDADWNTNLPYTCDTEEIFQHIKKNKGDDAITDNAVRAAIRLIQAAARIAAKDPRTGLS